MICWVDTRTRLALSIALSLLYKLSGVTKAEAKNEPWLSYDFKWREKSLAILTFLEEQESLQFLRLFRGTIF